MISNSARIIGTAVMLGSVVSLPIASSAGQTVAGVSAGTLGAALSISQPIDQQTTIRFTYGSFRIARQQDFDNVVIDVLTRLHLSEQFRVQSAGLYIERRIRPTIHLTIGAVNNQNHISALSIPADSSIVINTHVYSAAQAGEVFTNVKWMPLSPYIGFGFFPRASDRRRFALVAEIGAYYQGRATVTFDANGAIKANQTKFATYFDTLQRQLSRELSPVELYPVVQLGLRLRL